MMAFVVAMAGIMFPAICLISKRDLVSIPNTIDLKLAAAATKSSVSSSSLSKVMTGSAELAEPSDFMLIKRLLKRLRLIYVSQTQEYKIINPQKSHLSLKTATFSCSVQVL